MKIAFVVQRYGADVNGGAELEARQIAERLSAYVQVEALTTCATDYLTWSNVYPPGVEKINGVTVRRFPVGAPRDINQFGVYHNEMLARPRTIYDETRWMQLQGPDVTEMTRYIREHEAEYDLFFFFTYLYASTWANLPLVAHKALLFPTAHDEPPIYLDLFQSVFKLPRGFVFNSREEDAFVRKKFQNSYIPGVVLGVGIDVPHPPPTQTLQDDYVLYLGRIDLHKGCDQLFDYFLRYKQQTGDPVKLALIGTEAMAIPEHPDIVRLGFMKDERFAWLQNAKALILPSPFESLSLVTLESWALGVPVLVNGQCEVLAGHCKRSNGGLYYTSQDEFMAALELLRSNPNLCRRFGENGRRYVEKSYDWNVVTQGYLAFFKKILAEIHASNS